MAKPLELRGSGKVEIDLNDAIAMLGKGKQTIRRYIRQCKKDGLFRSVRRDGTKYIIHYASLSQVACAAGISELGGFGRVSMEQLKHIKIAATEIEAEYLQAQSMRKKRDELRSQGKRGNLNSLDRIFEAPSDNCRGGTSKKPIKRKSKKRKSRPIIHIGPRAVFVSSYFTVYGGSQAEIAKRLGNRSDRTIRRRLSNKYRSDRNIPPIKKKQVCQAVSLAKADWKQEARSLFDAGEHELGLEVGRLFNSGGTVFRAGCNVYDTGIEVVGKRSLKRRFKKLFQQSYKGQK